MINRIYEGKWVARVFLMAWVMITAACSTGYTVKTFDGPQDDQSVALLKVSEDLNLVALDGEQMKSYLLEDLAIDYKILPGPHTAIFKYSGVWAAPRKDTTDKGPNAERVESRLLRVDFYAAPGVEYEFRYQKPENRREAQAMSVNFTADLVEVSGKLIAAAQPFDPASGTAQESAAIVASGKTAGQNLSEKSASAVGSVVEGVQTMLNPGSVKPKVDYPKPAAMSTESEPMIVAAPVVSPSSGNLTPGVPDGLPRLEALKVMWQQASKEEKKAFLRWAFE